MAITPEMQNLIGHLMYNDEKIPGETLEGLIREKVKFVARRYRYICIALGIDKSTFTERSAILEDNGLSRLKADREALMMLTNDDGRRMLQHRNGRDALYDLGVELRLEQHERNTLIRKRGMRQVRERKREAAPAWGDV